MKAKSRSAIISAALELFAKKGFSATTADEIAKKAKVSKGLIFSHFLTKENILLAILDDEIDRFLPKFDQNDEARDPKEKLVSFINGWLRLLEKEPLLVLLSLRLNLDESWRKILRKKGKQYVEIYLKRMRALLVQAGSKKPDLDCYLIGVLFDGVAANYVAAPKLFPLNDIKNYLVELLFSYWQNQK
jgi:AcrR family transcriptional regulator